MFSNVLQIIKHLLFLSCIFMFCSIPWAEEPDRLQSTGLLRVRHDWATSLSRIGEGNGNPLQCSCLENPGTGEPGGLPSMGSHSVGHDWSDLAVAVVLVINAPVLAVAVGHDWATEQQLPHLEKLGFQKSRIMFWCSIFKWHHTYQSLGF